MENLRSSNNKAGNRKWKFSKFAPILAGALFLINPSWAKAQDVSNHTRTKAEVSTSTILDKLNKELWISLPDEYNDKILDFVLNDTIMHTRSATAYTENFIINEMKKDRWVSKQNQLLFIRSTIYAWISQRTLYDRLDDENENRSDEYEKALKQINSSYEEYKKWFKTYIEKWIADADRRSAEAERRIADADSLTAQYKRESAKALEENMKADSLWLKEIIKFYHIYERNPKIVRQEEIAQTRENAKLFINDCIKHWIDYRAVLLKEVWDKRKVEEILKFYGVE